MATSIPPPLGTKQPQLAALLAHVLANEVQFCLPVVDAAFECSHAFAVKLAGLVNPVFDYILRFRNNEHVLRTVEGRGFDNVRESICGARVALLADLKSDSEILGRLTLLSVALEACLAHDHLEYDMWTIATASTTFFLAVKLAQRFADSSDFI